MYAYLTGCEEAVQIGFDYGGRPPRLPDEMFGPGKVRCRDGVWFVPLAFRVQVVKLLSSAGFDVVEKYEQDEKAAYWRRVVE